MADDVQTPMDNPSQGALSTDQGAAKIHALLYPQDNQAKPQEAPVQAEIEGDAVEPAATEEIEQSETDEGEALPELYEVLVDGEKKSVPLEELIKGYQIEAHYTKKSQKLADERKAFEAERAVISGVNEKFKQLDEVVVYLQQMNQYVESTLPPEPDQALLESNPAAYIKAQEARNKALQNLQVTQQGVAQTKAKAKELLAELQRHGAQVISQKMPELLQPETSQKLYGYLQESYGYTPEQINSNVDPHLFIIAEKARRFDELQAQSVNPKHVAQKATTAKAKPRPYQNQAQQRHKTAKAEFSKNPSASNAARLIKEMGIA